MRLLLLPASILTSLLKALGTPFKSFPRFHFLANLHRCPLVHHRSSASAMGRRGHDDWNTRVARVLSQAPASLNLTAENAANLLTHYGSVRKAAEAAKRTAAAQDRLLLRPVSAADSLYQNMRNAGNSCYMNAVFAAGFAEWAAWDPLIVHSTREDDTAASLRDAVRNLVNCVRAGETAEKEVVQRVREEMIRLNFHRGRAQEDASEFFAHLVEKLGAPLLPFGVSLRHEGIPEDADEVWTTERLIWLDLPQGSSSSAWMIVQNDRTSFHGLLQNFFFGEVREGLRRQMPDTTALVDALATRVMLPEYTPLDGAQDKGPAMRRLFQTLAVPFAIRRYSSPGNKNRMYVDIPTVIDFSEYVSSRSAIEKYSLILRSVVCHVGNSVTSGHYVAYTYNRDFGWRKWDDMDYGAVETCNAEMGDQLPSKRRWRDAINRDSYIVFYELIPGDASVNPYNLSEVYSSLDQESMDAVVREAQSREDGVIASMKQDRELAKFIAAGGVWPSKKNSIADKYWDSNFASDDLENKALVGHRYDYDYRSDREDEQSCGSSTAPSDPQGRSSVCTSPQRSPRPEEDFHSCAGSPAYNPQYPQVNCYWGSPSSYASRPGSPTVECLDS